DLDQQLGDASDGGSGYLDFARPRLDPPGSDRLPALVIRIARGAALLCIAPRRKNAARDGKAEETKRDRGEFRFVQRDHGTNDFSGSIGCCFLPRSSPTMRPSSMRMIRSANGSI